jgi:hypothetical protein
MTFARCFAPLRDGKSMLARMLMIVMTTSNSINVNALARRFIADRFLSGVMEQYAQAHQGKQTASITDVIRRIVGAQPKSPSAMGDEIKKHRER